MANILAIGAHPDDIEIGMGGALRKLLREGHEVLCVDLTDGEPTPHGTREIRRKETLASNQVLGITRRVCLDLPNRVLLDTEEARRRLAAEMRAFRPDLVFTHVERDAHPDHVAAAQITRGAVLLSRIVKIDLSHEPFRPGPVFHFLCSHLRYPYQPSFVLEVSEADYLAKLEAVMQYESQFVVNKDNARMRDFLSTRMKYFGALIRRDYGEGFLSEEPIGLKDVTALL
ncbi:MAG: bacillithiol biosynthesis deacetylase BshB1 [Planctomycetota bacterium]